MLERFGFTGDRLTARVGDLSGGERRRFELLRLLLSEPNVLLLDEPTNDLDIDTLTVLEDFLDRWPGTLVVVSHDRYFLERVTDSVWALLGDGQISMLPRGVDEYLENRAAEQSPPTAARAVAAEQPRVTSGSAGERAARKTIARIQKQTAPVEKVANTILKALTDEKPKARYLVGLDAKAQVAMRAALPTRAFDLAVSRATGGR